MSLARTRLPRGPIPRFRGLKPRVPELDDRYVASSPPHAWSRGPIRSAGPAGTARCRPEPLIERLLALLDLQPDDLLVQLGCAFPGHLLALTQRVPLRYQALVVDSSEERLARFVGTPMLRRVTMDPLRFVAYGLGTLKGRKFARHHEVLAWFKALRLETPDFIVTSPPQSGHVK